MTTTGDVNGAVVRLQRELKQLKYSNPVDEVGLKIGDPAAVLPLLHFVLLRFSRHVASCIAVAGYELQGKTDQRFAENAFKLFRDCLGIRTVLTVLQFLEQGFAERKILLLCDVISTCKKIHNDEIRKERLAALKSRTGGPSNLVRLHEPSRKTPEVKIIKGGQEIRQVVSPVHLPNAAGGAQSVYTVKQRIASPAKSGASRHGASSSAATSPAAAAALHVERPPFTAGLAWLQEADERRTPSAEKTGSRMPQAGGSPWLQSWLGPESHTKAGLQQQQQQQQLPFTPGSSWLGQQEQQQEQQRFSETAAFQTGSRIRAGGDAVEDPLEITFATRGGASLATPTIHSWFANPAYAPEPDSLPEEEVAAAAAAGDAVGTRGDGRGRGAPWPLDSANPGGAGEEREGGAAAGGWAAGQPAWDSNGRIGGAGGHVGQSPWDPLEARGEPGGVGGQAGRLPERDPHSERLWNAEGRAPMFPAQVVSEPPQGSHAQAASEPPQGAPSSAHDRPGGRGPMAAHRMMRQAEAAESAAEAEVAAAEEASTAAAAVGEQWGGGYSPHRHHAHAEPPGGTGHAAWAGPGPHGSSSNGVMVLPGGQHAGTVGILSSPAAAAAAPTAAVPAAGVVSLQQLLDLEMLMMGQVGELVQRLIGTEQQLQQARQEALDTKEAMSARVTVLEGRVRFLECEVDTCVRRGEYRPEQQQQHQQQWDHNPRGPHLQGQQQQQQPQGGHGGGAWTKSPDSSSPPGNSGPAHHSQRSPYAAAATDASSAAAPPGPPQYSVDPPHKRSTGAPAQPGWTSSGGTRDGIQNHNGDRPRSYPEGTTPARSSAHGAVNTLSAPTPLFGFQPASTHLRHTGTDISSNNVHTQPDPPGSGSRDPYLQHSHQHQTPAHTPYSSSANYSSIRGGLDAAQWEAVGAGTGSIGRFVERAPPPAVSTSLGGAARDQLLDGYPRQQLPDPRRARVGGGSLSTGGTLTPSALHHARASGGAPSSGGTLPLLHSAVTTYGDRDAQHHAQQRASAASPNAHDAPVQRVAGSAGWAGGVEPRPVASEGGGAGGNTSELIDSLIRRYTEAQSFLVNLRQSK